ncbi:hypothetical protein SAMN05660405_02446 [Psychrobacter pacificensis]|uniref:Uncharacterized protein n=1 Tax=Psychrobacter pacificensis TaxID=112002 RepID=A0A1G7AHP3_9GAMM|nr:hypothetical protein [Psychrobacter pacificensis]GLR27775.1 hypothetical protein GCM10007915_00130 [Psychrobacter pacificensis]SDE13575.1 hypothetical protein SAMN05660405_02446 [Psychrobacter pacificensis]
MEDTMSSYSFSHQFYQRWTCAPETVRAAITQELKDITTLLQAETVFESFEFDTHDLDAYVDELYDNYNAEQAIAKAIIDKQEQERAAAEKQQLEEAQKKEAEETARKAEAAQKEQEKNEELAANKTHNKKDNLTEQEAVDDAVDHLKTEKVSTGAASGENNNSTDSQTISKQDATLSDKPIKNIPDNANTTINLVLEDSELDATDQTLIRELESQIDDYLSEQMMLLSENLKSWLRAEMTQHFSEKNAPAPTENAAKKNIH